jgi:protein involved in polysaccharide export with SLBB domain
MDCFRNAAPGLKPGQGALDTVPGRIVRGLVRGCAVWGLALACLPTADAQTAERAAMPPQREQAAETPNAVSPGPGPNRLEQASPENYRLGLGDELNVYFSFRPQPPVEAQKLLPHDELWAVYQFALPDPDEHYRIQPFDELYLNFRYSPELSQLYTEQKDDKIAVLSRPYIVQPEGTIVLTGVNKTLRVQDLTTSDVKQLVEKAYAPLLQEPQVAVNVSPAFRREETLRDALGLNRIEPLNTVVPDDGKLSLPLISEVNTRGKTIQQVSREVSDRYHELGYPKLTVNLLYKKIADERHRQLRDLLGNAGRVKSAVNPSGRLTLPLCPDFDAAGKTAAQVARELTAYYQRRGLERVEVDAQLAAPRSRVVRVLGAVARPGVFAFEGQSDLWGAIAQCGGFGAEADPTRVVVIPRPGAKPLGPFDYHAFVRSGDGAQDPLLTGDELIHVPKKGDPS